MKATITTFVALLCTFACCMSAHADVVLSNFVSVVQDVDPGTNTIQTGYTPTGGTNSVLFVTFSFDDAGDPADAMTFGGVAMTKVETGANRIFYLANPSTTSGDIILTTTSSSDGGGDELLTIGTLLNVDTTGIEALTGSTVAGTVQSGPGFSGLDPGSFVLTQFISNNHTGSYSPIAGNPFLASLDQGGSAFDGLVTGASGVTGDFTPAVDGYAGTAGFTAISIAFTAAVPEPGSAGILAFALALVGSRRRRKI